MTYTLHYLDGAAGAPVKFRSLKAAKAAADASSYACLIFDDTDGRVIYKSR